MPCIAHIPNLAEILACHEITAFCETGCHQGASLLMASEVYGLSCFSCDIRAGAVERCRRRVPDATIRHCESMEFLRWFLEHGPRSATFFWLDAHFPMFYPEGCEGPHFPLLDEVRLLQAGRDTRFDVFGCDDINYIAGDDNPYFRPDVPRSEELIVDEFSLTQLWESLTTHHDLSVVTTGVSSILLARPRLTSPRTASTT